MLRWRPASKRPARLLEDAKGLFHATIRDAWAPDGADGFVYSVDWDGKPIVRERVRWPIVEAMGTAYALYTLTGDSQYEEWYQKWWDYCIKYLMDYENGSWWQELDADNKVTTKVWDGKQDIYHLLHCWSFLVCHWRRAWLQRSRRVSGYQREIGHEDGSHAQRWKNYSA